MWTIRFAKSRMRESRTSGVLWGVYDRKGCTYSTFGLYERLARWKRRKDYYNKMDNDIPENQQDREIAVSDIKHLDQSKKEKILWLQLFLFLKKIGFMKNLELFYLEMINYLILLRLHLNEFVLNYGILRRRMLFLVRGYNNHGLKIIIPEYTPCQRRCILWDSSTVLMTVYRVTQRQAARSLYCHLKLPSTVKRKPIFDSVNLL